VIVDFGNLEIGHLTSTEGFIAGLAGCSNVESAVDSDAVYAFVELNARQLNTAARMWATVNTPDELDHSH
jgi:uncharacterized protein YceK